MRGKGFCLGGAKLTAAAAHMLYSIKYVAVRIYVDCTFSGLLYVPMT